MLKENLPNAAKLISSLRNTGYNSYSAIEDIIDNSIDAGAKIIHIDVKSHKNDLNMYIADNGGGMSEDVLDDALKLGSMFEKNETSDLGKYGMGLVTASISMAKRLEVVTKTKEDSIWQYSCQDLDSVIEQNHFVKESRPANNAEVKMLQDILTTDSGTLVFISKIDRLSDSNVSQFTSKLNRDVGRIYRKFIEAGIQIFINGKSVSIIDPLMRENKETKIYSEDEYEIPNLRRKEKIVVKIAVLPDVNDELAKELKMNQVSQGFYILRNSREIAAGESLNVFQKHNRFNRLRIELQFDSSLDNEMGVKFSKDGVNPNQALTDFLKEQIGGQISSIDKLLLKPKAADPSRIVNHDESANVIARKAKLLIVPDAQIEKRGPHTNPKKEKPEPIGKNKNRLNLKDIKTSPAGMGVRFETVSAGITGSVYECYQTGKIIVIQWNVDHPFYDKIVLPNKDNKNIVSALDYLVFGFAAAELKAINDDNREVISNIKSVMSANVRALLN